MRRMAAVILALGLLAAGCSTSEPAGRNADGSRASNTEPPRLRVEEVADGFTNAWDVGFLPDGKVLLTQRPGRISLLSSARHGASVSPVRADLSDIFAEGEGGLMGLAVHPDFASSREFTTCQTHTENGRPKDIRLVTWRLADNGRSARRVADPLLGGLPINPSGRHSGCQPALGPDGSLLVGTGDTATANVAQNRHSLGGKLLRLNLKTGKPLPDNPFAHSANRNERYVYSYGHRNVQGVAVRPGTDVVYTAEQGPDDDDEVNRSVAGANYGWDPSQGGRVSGYDENVPMTDLGRFPHAVRAVWSSGNPTEATSGSTFLSGQRWGAWNGALAVSALKGSKLLLLRLRKNGSLRDVAVPAALNGKYGRLRAAVLGPDDALYVTTSNSGDDKLLRVTPS
ncbi:MAG: PQQ-dependent sugar dehydrogenase [Sciscionella sp.]